MLKIEKQIIRHEGFRQMAFIGPQGAHLIGYGRNIKSKGLTQDEAMILLKNDIQECVVDLHDIFDNFSELNEDRRFALIDMMYTLGSAGFRDFRRMIDAVKNGDYALAAKELRDSMWYDQVGRRGIVLYEMMLCGDNK